MATIQRRQMRRTPGTTLPKQRQPEPQEAFDEDEAEEEEGFEEEERPAPRSSNGKSRRPDPVDDLDDDEEDDGPPPRRTSNAPDPEDMLSGGAPSAKFAEVGDSITGKILAMETTQQRDFMTKKLKFYEDSGQPMWQVVITVQTKLDEDEDDDGQRRIFAKGQMLGAIKEAARKAGARSPKVGGQIQVKYTSDEPPPKRGMNPQKIFTVKYRAPAEG